MMASHVHQHTSEHLEHVPVQGTDALRVCMYGGHIYMAMGCIGVPNKLINIDSRRYRRNVHISSLAYFRPIVKGPASTPLRELAGPSLQLPSRRYWYTHVNRVLSSREAAGRSIYHPLRSYPSAFLLITFLMTEARPPPIAFFFPDNTS